MQSDEIRPNEPGQGKASKLPRVPTKTNPHLHDTLKCEKVLYGLGLYGKMIFELQHMRHWTINQNIDCIKIEI